MHAIQIAPTAGPKSCPSGRFSSPVPGADEVVIRTAASSLRTAASSLNPVDWKTRAGEVGSELPATPGWDLAGVVTVTATGYPG